MLSQRLNTCSASDLCLQESVWRMLRFYEKFKISVNRKSIFYGLTTKYEKN